MTEQEFWADKQMREHAHFVTNIANEEIICAKQKSDYNLVSILKPKFSIDGNMWCVLHGENIQDGVAGFGSSPYLAVLDFNKAFNESLLDKGPY